MRVRPEIPALVIIVAFIIVMTALARREDINVEQMQPAAVVRSSFRTFPEGYKALYRTLGMRYPVRRLNRPYAMLPPRGLLIVADPYREAITRYEARELLRWVRAGNHALIIVEYHPEVLFALQSEAFPAAGAGEESDENGGAVKPPRDDDWLEQAQRFPSRLETGRATPVTASFLSDAASDLRVQSTVRFPMARLLPRLLDERVGGAVPLYRDRAGVAVAYTALGAGSIVWCSSPWSFSNAGIREGHNLELVLALANLQPGAPVIFDEYHHGIGTGMSVWSLLPPLTKLGIGLLALTGLLLLHTLSWRFGRAQLPVEERFTRSRAEYLTSMAGLLERMNATHVVAQRLRVRLSRTLGQRLGLPARVPLTQLLEANGRRRVVDQAALARIVNQLTVVAGTRHPEPMALLRTMREVDALLSRRGEK